MLVERDLSEKYGDFSLFGMCQRENNTVRHLGFDNIGCMDGSQR